jgi:hypothetical protein
MPSFRLLAGLVMLLAGVIQGVSPTDAAAGDRFSKSSSEAPLSPLTYRLPASMSAEEREQHAIWAEDVVHALKAGRVVEIENAVIHGPFILRSASTEGTLSIKRTKITDIVDWSYATVKGVLTFEDVTFEKEKTFAAVTIEKDIFLDQVTL